MVCFEDKYIACDGYVIFQFDKNQIKNKTDKL